MNKNIVGSLPAVDFVHKCRSILAIETKTLGGYRIVKAVKVMEHHSDDTSLWCVSFGNSILNIATDARYENVALSLKIFAADETSEIRVAAIRHTFLEGRNLLNNWCDVTCRMKLDQQDLLDTFLDPMKLRLARISERDWPMTHTCNTAQKFRNLLREIIEPKVTENRMLEDVINVYKADFWHHLLNVWIGGKEGGSLN